MIRGQLRERMPITYGVISRETLTASGDEDDPVLPRTSFAQAAVYSVRVVREDSQEAVGENGSSGRAHTILGCRAGVWWQNLPRCNARGWRDRAQCIS